MPYILTVMVNLELHPRLSCWKDIKMLLEALNTCSTQADLDNLSDVYFGILGSFV